MAGEKRDLLITIAKMYYRQGLSQEQIAEEVRLSRPTVSRMLKACVKEGIVQIRIDDISSYGISLGEKIRDKFGIEEAIIVPSGNNVEESKQNVAEAVARYLEMNLQNESLLGISWGTTLSKVVDNMGKSPAKKVDVIQMVGGLGKSMNDTDVTSITLRMAKALNGDYYILQAPFMVQSKVLRDLLLDEPQIREHFQRIHETKIAVVGLGTTEPELSAQFKSGHITYEDVQRLRSIGAVGDICGNYLDINGNECLTTLAERMISITLQDLSELPCVVGIAAGKQKTDIILGALRGKYINVLITDEEAALSVLEG